MKTDFHETMEELFNQVEDEIPCDTEHEQRFIENIIEFIKAEAKEITMEEVVKKMISCYMLGNVSSSINEQ